MRPARSVTRRDFLRRSAFGGAGLLIAVSATEVLAWHPATATAAEFHPNAFLHISTGDQVTVWVTRSEMGQGVRTVLPLLLAEELEVELSKVRLLQAATTRQFDGIRLRTSGSGSSAGSWRPLRQAGATAREMLISAAVQQWQVDRSECKAQNGSVIHPPSGRSLRYGELAATASQLPVPKDPPLKNASQFRLIGGRHKRVDSRAIVTGQARYGIDVRIPGMRYAVAARCPVLGGKLGNWDATNVKKLPGVYDVVPIHAGIAPGLAITADSTWTALKARELLQMEWEPGPHAAFNSEAFYAELRSALRREGYLIRTEGHPEAFNSARGDILEADYEWPYQVHAPLEPMNCTAHVHDGKCEIWVPTQAPEEAQQRSAKLLGVDPTAVTANVTMLGGGFGRRLFTDYVVEAVELSRAVSAPVQLLWTREDDMKYGYFNPASFNRFVARLGEDRRVLAFHHRCASSDLSIYPPPSERSGKQYADDGSPWGAYDNPYRFAALRVEYVPLESPVPTGPWRAVEYPGTVFGRECFVDELAHAAGVDPIQYRLELLKPGDTLELGDQKIDRSRLIAVLELVAEKSGWDKPLAQKGGRRRGRGVACNVYHAGTHIAQVAEISIGPDGAIRVERVVCALDLGQPLNLLGIEGQVESAVIWALSSTLKSAMTFHEGRAQSSSYADYPLIRLHETPAIETHVVRSPQRPYGLGEQPVPVVAPAVANAVFAATGKRIRRLPIRPEDLT